MLSGEPPSGIDAAFSAKSAVDAGLLRALAVAQEQEMRAHVEENRAKLVLAEAEVPQAISQALREGKLGVMEYYNLRNLQSDTEMRSAIAGVGTSRPAARQSRVARPLPRWADTTGHQGSMARFDDR